MTLREVLDAVIGVGTWMNTAILPQPPIGWGRHEGTDVASLVVVALLALWYVKKNRPHLPVFQSLWFIAGRTFARFLKAFKAR
jgi:hypothetical protein